MTENASNALSWLADSKEGDKILAELAEFGEKFRSSLPTEVDNEELKYIMEKLWAQRSATGWSEKINFDLQPNSILAKQNKKITIPREMAVGLKVRSGGFIIKASIPQAKF